ncbi:hypothetical protein G7092_25685 [Mucilaginibacter sp. HC2]|jgi:hypothetical protein|uniref:hypothetical protein n=1 Tax=Mucilaginibacter inviolabilis TaxID=2714892 RepID=UPI001408399A|nr:hypothetical protein [Mucilaginibacter inviolabilis]NHA07216.1 hypothetical protein [Mucilaginibacter inviolabilis]
MIDNITNDRIAVFAVILAAITGIYGLVKLKKLSIKAPVNILTDEQSDLLVMGIFHLLICAVSIFSLL